VCSVLTWGNVDVGRAPTKIKTGIADVLSTIVAGETFCVRTKCLPAVAFDVLQQSSLCLDGAHLPRVQHSRASLFAKKGLMHSPAVKTRNDIPTATASWDSFRKITFSLPEQARICQSLEPLACRNRDRSWHEQSEDDARDGEASNRVTIPDRAHIRTQIQAADDLDSLPESVR